MKSAPKAPTPVDPAAITGAQSTASINSAIADKTLNNTNTSNPFGSTGTTQTGSVNVGGQQVPTYSSTSSLSPLLQSLLNTQEGAAGAAAGNINTAPLNFSSLPSVQDPTLLNQNTSNALYNQATSRLDPQWATNDRQLQDRLATQGIPLGSEAYDHAMQNFNLAKNDAYTSAQNSASQYGVQDASTLLQDQIAARNQGIGEQVTGQNQPLSVLSQVLAGINGVGGLAPNSASPTANVQAPDVMGAYGLQANQQQNAYNAQMQQYQSMLGGLSGLGGTALTYAMLA